MNKLTSVSVSQKLRLNVRFALTSLIAIALWMPHGTVAGNRICEDGSPAIFGVCEGDTVNESRRPPGEPRPEPKEDPPVVTRPKQQQKSRVDRYLELMSSKSAPASTNNPVGRALMGTAAIIDSYAMLPSATSSDISGTAGDAFGGNKNKDPVAFGNPDAMVAKAIRLQDKREAELVALRH